MVAMVVVPVSVPVVMGVVMGVVIVMPVVMAMRVVMMVMMRGILPVILGLPPCLPFQRRAAAPAYRAHHTTSMSLIRISSPPTGISRPPPQRGQGSSRFSISTSTPQS